MLREGDGGNGGLVGVRGARGGELLEGFWFALNFVRFCSFGSCLVVSLSSRRDFLSFFFAFFEWLDLLSGLSSHLYPVPLTGVEVYSPEIACNLPLGTHHTRITAVGVRTHNNMARQLTNRAT